MYFIYEYVLTYYTCACQSNPVNKHVKSNDWTNSFYRWVNKYFLDAQFKIKSNKQA